MTELTHHDITRLLLAIAVMVGFARLLGEFARRLKQPAVIGELTAGILLGPTVLGTLFPDAAHALFPTVGPVATVLQGLSVIAVTLFLLVAGMEVDLSIVWRRRMQALTVGIGGMAVPLGLSFVAAYFFPRALGAEEGVSRAIFALFFGTAISISALPVIAKILMDLQVFRTEMGMTIVAAAVFNDLCGWICFAMTLALIGLGSAAGLVVWQTIVFTLLFVLVTLTVGRWLINRSLPWIQAHTSWPGGVLSLSLAVAIACAAFTEWIGVHAIFGAFIFGIALGDSPHFKPRTRATLDQFISFIFAPIFFVSIGLSVNFAKAFDPMLVTLVIVIGTVLKVLSGRFSATLAGYSIREAWAIGCCLNARGAMEIILGLLAMQAGLIGERLFVALVVMALFTSVTAGPLMQWALGRVRRLRFVDFASSKTFIPAMNSTTPKEAIAELSAAAAPAAGLNADVIQEMTWAREMLMSSGIERGVAVPHARLVQLAHPVVAIGIARSGIDFQAMDGQLSRLIVLMLTPAGQSRVNIELLGSIARSFDDQSIVEAACHVKSWTEFLAILNISDSDQQHEEGRPAST